MKTDHRSPISIVVPVLNDVKALACLLKTLQSLRCGYEIVVVDGGSSDSSRQIAAQYPVRLIECQAQRAAQMNAGAWAASGDWIAFLHADSKPDRRWVRALSSITCLSDGWGFFEVSLDQSDGLLKLVERLMNLRSRITSIGTGDQCIFVHRRLFEKARGYPSQPLMEDVELCKRLRKFSRPMFMDAPITTSSRRWQEKGVLRTVLLMWTLRLGYWLGVPPRKLARIYYPGANITPS